jgi:hypothetical protein
MGPTANADVVLCKVLGCRFPAAYRDLCEGHFQLWAEKGRVPIGQSPRQIHPTGGRVCMVEECTASALCKGFCKQHYDRGRRGTTCPACGSSKVAGSASCEDCWTRFIAGTSAEKRCSGCNLVRSVGDFSWRRSYKGMAYLRSRCRDCERAASKERYRQRVQADAQGAARHKSMVNRRSAERAAITDPFGMLCRAVRMSARKLGLDPALVVKRFIENGNVCEGCGTKGTLGHRGRVCIDHCHTTGAFRGFLCGSCNKAAGHVRDDPDRLEALARYLRERPQMILSLDASARERRTGRIHRRSSKQVGPTLFDAHDNSSAA